MMNLPISRDDFFWSFSILCQWNRIPLKSDVLLRQYESPYSLSTFRLIMEHAGCALRQKTVPVSQLSSLPTPCLGVMLPVSVESLQLGVGADVGPAARESYYRIVMLESVDAKWVSYVEACGKDTIVVPRQEFEKQFAGEVLIMNAPAGQTKLNDGGRGGRHAAAADSTASQVSRPAFMSGFWRSLTQR